jgi:hypothetical protein
MQYEHHANMVQANVNQNKTFLLGSINQIDILIQRYLQKLRKKSSVKHVHIDRNITLNIEPFRLGLIPVVWLLSLLWSRLFRRIQTLVLLYKSAQSTRTNYGIVTLIQISDCKTSLPINTKSETPTNKQHIQNLARYFKFCTNTDT